MSKQKVYVVTEYNHKDEPIITVFDTREVAEKYAQYIYSGGGLLTDSTCCVDETKIYQAFKII